MTRLRAYLHQHGLTLLFGATILAYCFNPLKESDAFYHLAAGKLIVQARSIPHADPFSYIAQGSTWIPHEWLAQVLAYGTYVLSGYWGLMLGVALVGVATFLIVARLGSRTETPRAFTLSLTLILGSLAFDAWIARPQILASFLCALLLLVLEAYRRQPRMLHLFGIAGVLLLWANLHASFLLGIVIAGWYACALLLATYVPTLLAQPLTRAQAVRLLAAVGIGAALCLINPTGYHAFLYSLYVRPAVNAFNIMEWKSLLAFTGTPERIAAVLIAAAGLFCAWWYGLRRGSRDLIACGMGLGMAALPFIAVRHEAFFAVAGVPFVVAGFSAFLHPWLSRVTRVQLAWFFSALAVLMFVGRLVTFPTTYYDRYRIPVTATDFAERVNLGRTFNLYNEGGYLIWRRYPQEQVSIDGRSEVYVGPPLQDFLRLVSVTPNWDSLVAQYKIQAFFLAYNPEQLRHTIQPLLNKLKAEGWVPIYWDDLVVIYVPDDVAHQALIDQYGLRYVDPFGDPQDVPREHAQEAAAELQRVVELSPMNGIPLNYAQRFLAQMHQ